MDRRLAAVAVAVAVAALGCGGAGGARVVGRGTLGYAVALTDDRLYTVELDLRFALVVRDRTSGRIAARHDLGPPERDLPALAVADGVAFVGGADHQVRAIGLADGQVGATWRHGAAVTAVAVVPGGWLVIGDATGALCLRRLADGALVHCAVVAAAPIATLTAVGPTVVATMAGTMAGRAVTVAVPALTWSWTAPPGAAVRGRAVVVGGREVARFVGPARAVAVDRAGRWAAVGWIRALGDPSVIVGEPPSPRGVDPPR